MVQFPVRGLVPAVFTPIKDESVNVDIIPKYAQYLSENGVRAVLVGGTTGQNTLLRLSDRKKLANAWVEAGKTTGLHIMVHVGGAAFPDVIELAKYCASTGVDSIITLPELYFRPQTVSQLVSYVGRVAEAAPNLPIFYYHIPRMSKVEINMPEFVKEASKNIPNFKGIKFSSIDLAEAVQVLKILKDDQELFFGGDRLIAAASLLGMRSFIGASTNVFPELMHGILEAIEKKDILKAREIQNKVTSVLDSLIEEGHRTATMKAAMTIKTGINVGPPCIPMEPLSDSAYKTVELKLKNLQLI